MKTPRYLLLYALAVLCALFDATLSHRLTLFFVRPELLYVIPLFWALQEPSDEVLLHSWTAGLIKDLFSISAFGTYGFLFALIAFLYSLVQPYLYRDSVITLFLTAIAFQLLVNGLYALYFFLSGANQSFSEILLFCTATSFYSAVLGLFLLRPLIFFEDYLVP